MGKYDGNMMENSQVYYIPSGKHRKNMKKLWKISILNGKSTNSMGCLRTFGGFPTWGVTPIAGWFISWKIPIYKWMMTGVPLFLEASNLVLP